MLTVTGRLIFPGEYLSVSIVFRQSAVAALGKTQSIGSLSDDGLLFLFIAVNRYFGYIALLTVRTVSAMRSYVGEKELVLFGFGTQRPVFLAGYN